MTRDRLTWGCVAVMVGALVAACGGATAPAPASIPVAESPLPERLQPKVEACHAGEAEACDAVAAHYGGGSTALTCIRRSTVATRTCQRTDEMDARGAISAMAVMPFDEVGQVRRARRGARREEWNGRAAALYGARCEAGEAGACVARGRIVADVEDGDYTAEPRAWFERALSTWDAACAAGDMRACLELRRAYREGLIVDRDRAQTARATLRACGAGHRMSCRELINPYRSAQRLYTPPPRKGGEASLLGSGASAFDSAAVVIAMGGSPDPEPYQRACRKGTGLACIEAGWLLAGRDAAASKTAYRRARRLLEPRCSRGQGDACLGLSAVHAAGHGVKPDPERAERLMVQACERGSAEACARRGTRLALVAEPARRVDGLEALRSGCAAESARACAMAGVLVLSGRDVPVDQAEGCAHLERACAGNRRACLLRRSLCGRTSP